MAALGEQFPGRKVTKDDLGATGHGELLPPGPLDLDSGQVVLRPRPARAPAEGAEVPESASEPPARPSSE